MTNSEQQSVNIIRVNNRANIKLPAASSVTGQFDFKDSVQCWELDIEIYHI